MHALPEALRSVVSLTALAIAAGCTSTPPRTAPVAISQLQAELQRATCERYFRCDKDTDHATKRLRFGSIQTCRMVLARQPDPRIEDLMQLVAAGVVRYDPVAGGRCVARAASACVSTWASLGACADVFTGTAATGEPCRRHEECAGDAWCDHSVATRDAPCTGSCQPSTPTGVPCARGSQACSRHSIDGRPYCRGGSPVSPPLCGELREGSPASEGAPCGILRVSDVLHLDTPCGPGLYCPAQAEAPSGLAPQATCRRLPTRGMRCNPLPGCWESQCVPAPDLRTGTCGDVAVRRQIGERCSPIDPFPYNGLCSPDLRLTCSASNVCESIGDGTEGSRCDPRPSSRDACDEGLYCDRVTARCTRKKPLGAPCEDSAECQFRCGTGVCDRICSP